MELIIDTPDGDFLEADHYKRDSKKLAIISHGLEGSSRARYVLGTAKEFIKNNWSVLAWNFRACGQSMNKLLPMYHSGKSEDLSTVIDYAINELGYSHIVLIGFSVGGNITLKYLGEKGDDLSPEVRAAAAISPPCDLGASADELARSGNFLYMANFLKSLGDKITKKSQQYPGEIDLRPLSSMRTFRDFDNAYTAPLNGFANAQDYYNRCSSISFLENIRIPTLILSAENDPFLPDKCYPVKLAEHNENLYLEIPETGGHVGFISRGKKGRGWVYRRVMEFMRMISR